MKSVVWLTIYTEKKGKGANHHHSKLYCIYFYSHQFYLQTKEAIEKSEGDMI